MPAMAIQRSRRGFTLAEAMIAILFICIAFFAYVSLHIRLIHSNAKLEIREGIKETVSQDMVTKLVSARAGIATTANVTSTNATNSTSTYPGSTSTTLPGEGTSVGTMTYRDPSLTATNTSATLPPNLALVESRLQWTDKNGLETYYVDCYERKALTRW